MDIAIGIVFDKNGKVLVAKRLLHSLGGGKWEFPGGKVEDGESVEQALNRELLEEVGLTVLEAVPFVSIPHPDKQLTLHAWLVKSYQGKAHGVEGQVVRWIDITQLNKIDMLAANKPIINAVIQYVG